MRCTSAFALCLLLTAVDKVALADDSEDDKSEEPTDYQDLTLVDSNSSASTENATPDSHEAMNNRELNTQPTANIREKRSYEFLMGLINNNSKYEVTKSESSTSDALQQKDNIAASELLLELMVKIVAHPFEWERVHNLLQKIDEDLVASKKIVDNFQNFHGSLVADEKLTNKHSEEVVTEKKSSVNKELYKNINITTTVNPQTELEDTNQTKKKKTNHTKSAIKTNSWPNFDGDAVTRTTNKYPWQIDNKSINKNTYPHNFAYHRVTGRPLYINKNPKAYIAVSVIAPKQLRARPQEEDITLENELRQLKPWTHNQNLKNMASIRSRWIIQTNEDKKGETPSP